MQNQAGSELQKSDDRSWAVLLCEERDDIENDFGDSVLHDFARNFGLI